jgi:hypothetical protein
MPSVNPGPATTVNPNLQSPISFERFIETISVAITPVAVATITVAEQSFGANGASFVTAATGILAGDVILAISPPSTVAGVGISQWRVDTAVNDKFYISFVNPTAGSLTPPSGQWLITVARFSTSNAPTPGTLASLPSTVY